MLTPCAAYKIINLLFTPYGYKFEEKYEYGGVVRSYELFAKNKVRRPDDDPWYVFESGRISVYTTHETAATLGGEGNYWNNTTYGSAGNFYLHTDNSSLSPSYANARGLGFSVRKKAKIIRSEEILLYFLRPMGISLKE